MNDADGVIRWEDPPRQMGGRVAGARKAAWDNRWAATVAALRARPGQWAVMYEGTDGTASSLASRVRGGLDPRWQPAGAYEAVARCRDGRTVTYVRYVGAQ